MVVLLITVSRQISDCIPSYGPRDGPFDMVGYDFFEKIVCCLTRDTYT